MRRKGFRLAGGKRKGVPRNGRESETGREENNLTRVSVSVGEINRTISEWKKEELENYIIQISCSSANVREESLREEGGN